MRVLIVGPQGAGKGTQAALLAENLKIPHISTGDIFRANAWPVPSSASWPRSTWTPVTWSRTR